MVSAQAWFANHKMHAAVRIDNPLNNGAMINGAIHRTAQEDPFVIVLPFATYSAALFSRYPCNTFRPT